MQNKIMWTWTDLWNYSKSHALVGVVVGLATAILLAMLVCAIRRLCRKPEQRARADSYLVIYDGEKKSSKKKGAKKEKIQTLNRQFSVSDR